MSKAKEEGVKSKTAARTDAMGRAGVRSMMSLQLEYRTVKADGAFQGQLQTAATGSSSGPPQKAGPTRRLDAAGDVGEAEPDFDAAEVAAC